MEQLDLSHIVTLVAVIGFVWFGLRPFIDYALAAKDVEARKTKATRTKRGWILFAMAIIVFIMPIVGVKGYVIDCLRVVLPVAAIASLATFRRPKGWR